MLSSNMWLSVGLRRLTWISRALTQSSCAGTGNGEAHGDTVKQNNVKICLHKWILILLLQHAAMLEDIMTSHENALQCVPEKRKPINQVNLSEKCNDLFLKVYIVTKFSLSSFFWHQLQDVLVMHGRARTISNGDVKIDLRRIGV